MGALGTSFRTSYRALVWLGTGTQNVLAIPALAGGQVFLIPATAGMTIPVIRKRLDAEQL